MSKCECGTEKSSDIRLKQSWPRTPVATLQRRGREGGVKHSYEKDPSPVPNQLRGERGLEASAAGRKFCLQRQISCVCSALRLPQARVWAVDMGASHTVKPRATATKQGGKATVVRAQCVLLLER